jgi:hypothetical protein
MSAEQCRRISKRLFLIEVVRPLRGRHFRHAAEKAVCRPGPHQKATIIAQNDKSRAAP